MGTFGSTVFKVIGVCVIVAFWGCRDPHSSGPDHSTPKIDPSHPEMVIMPVSIQSYGPNGLAWDLKAPSGQGYPSKNVFHAENLDLTLFDQGKKSTDIKADKGILNSKFGGTNKPPVRDPVFGGPELREGDMYLLGNVIFTSTDGTKAYLDWAHYQKNKGIIFSTGPVKIVREDSVTTGLGMEATADFQNIKIFNQTLVIKGKDEKLK